MNCVKKKDIEKIFAKAIIKFIRIFVFRIA